MGSGIVFVVETKINMIAVIDLYLQHAYVMLILIEFYVNFVVKWFLRKKISIFQSIKGHIHETEHELRYIIKQNNYWVKMSSKV